MIFFRLLISIGKITCFDIGVSAPFLSYLFAKLQTYFSVGNNF